MQAPGSCQPFKTKAHGAQIEEEDERIEESRPWRRRTQKADHGRKGHRANAGRHNQVCSPGGRGQSTPDSFDARWCHGGLHRQAAGLSLVGPAAPGPAFSL